MGGEPPVTDRQERRALFAEHEARGLDQRLAVVAAADRWEGVKVEHRVFLPALIRVPCTSGKKDEETKKRWLHP